MTIKFTDLLLACVAFAIAIVGVFNEVYFLTIFFGGTLASLAMFKLFFNENNLHQKITISLAGFAIALATTISAFGYKIEAEPMHFGKQVVKYQDDQGIVQLPSFKMPQPPKVEVPEDKPQVKIFDPSKLIKLTTDEEPIVEPLEQIVIDEPQLGLPPSNQTPEVIAPEPPKNKIPEPKLVEEPEIFLFVEEMPEFIGGMNELLKFLGNNIKYPALARENGIEGKVIVEFIVLEDGSISDVKIVRGLAGGCEEEALRVIKKMPNWKPGKQQGKAVKVKYKVPVRFKLQ